MWIGAYYIIVVLVSVWGIFSGYKRGFMRQIGVVLGVAFGIVATRMLSPSLLPTVEEWVPPSVSGFNRIYFCETLTCALIYLVVSGIVTALTIPVGKITSVLGIGVINSIFGALIRLFQFLMIISIFYNLLVDWHPDSDLTRSSRLHDGNIVEGVMKVAPPILGFISAEEVAYYQQLEDAKKIS